MKRPTGRVAGITIGCLLTVAAGAPAAFAQTNCKVVEGPGFFSRACGDFASVSAGPGQATSSTSTVPLPEQTFSPVVAATPLAPPPAPELTGIAPPPPTPARTGGLGGLIGGLLRLLGLG
ncbi:MAG: hypothetical protein ACT4OM_10545 [Actinomycetota bacterium]